MIDDIKALNKDFEVLKADEIYEHCFVEITDSCGSSLTSFNVTVIHVESVPDKLRPYFRKIITDDIFEVELPTGESYKTSTLNVMIFNGEPYIYMVVSEDFIKPNQVITWEEIVNS